MIVMEHTIQIVEKETGISRSTILHAAQRNAFPSRKSGKIILIDMETDAFKAWQEAHKNQPRVRGRQNKQVEDGKK